MLLSYNQLVQLVASGVVRNLDSSQIKSSSIDLRLGRTIQREIRPEPGAPIPWIDIASGQPLPMRVTTYKDGEYFFLAPGEFILAHTMEEFHLPRNISADFKLRSSRARQGVNHALAGWCDAGWNNAVLTMEIKNSSRYYHQRYRVGDCIGQVVLFQHEEVPEHASYEITGRYNGDKSVSGAKPNQ